MLQARLYAAAHAMQQRDARALLAEHPALLQGRPGDLVLDVGCGPGCVSAGLLRPAAAGRLVAVDSCPRMVEHARRTYGHQDIVFEQFDITEELTPEKRARLLPGAADGFHKVFSFYCLHWVQEQRQALRNIMLLLRPGGKALLVFLANCPVFTMYEVMSSKSLWRPYTQDFLRFVSPYQYNPQPAATLGKMLRDVGFKVTHCECRPCSFEYSSTQQLTDSLMAVNPFLNRIPEELKHSFISDCISEAMKLMSAKPTGGYESSFHTDDVTP
ncbi:juvenile hormone acid O-methyltransferase [Bacillus rossius redtenbacheri]|uniref:juvenile hormone acid O-methyltransferase n=1 Tax=Bacillus rossius redtenbacheri TaxID=93214 RepID=UPI002FDCBD6C